MNLPPPPYHVQRRAWDRAFSLVNDFADRLTLEQHVRLVVTSMYAPERLGWAEVGDAFVTWAAVVEVRV